MRAALLALALAAAPASLEDRRFLDGSVFVSEHRPALAFEVPQWLSYMGETETLLDGGALAQRHHFASVVGGRIDRLVILQFEHFVRDDGRYGFRIPDVLAGPDYRFSPDRIALGGFGFQHNTWAFDIAEDASRNPRHESAATLELIHGGELRLDAELLMSRYATEIGPERRAELILFYMEPLASHGLSLAVLAEGEGPRPDFDAASAAITARSHALFAGLEAR